MAKLGGCSSIVPRLRSVPGRLLLSGLPCVRFRLVSGYRMASSRISMRLCIYPGTFDPVTHGHLDVLERATRLFDHVLVSVAHNPEKRPLFTPEQRVELLKPNIARFSNVTVTTFASLLVDFAMEQKAVAIIRGLRAMSDFESEYNMALMNRHLQPAVETIYVMPNEDFSYTSSNLVKQVSKYGGDVTKFVPANVASALRSAYGFQ